MGAPRQRWAGWQTVRVQATLRRTNAAQRGRIVRDGPDKGSGCRFGLEHGRQRISRAFADDDNHLALAILIAGEAAINPVFFEIRGIDVTTMARSES
jgi:hypothetical protein